MRATMSSTVTKKVCSSIEEEDKELRRGPWSVEEDTILIHYVARHGEGRWNLLAKCSGLKRTGKSCRLRWLNYLKPDVKRGNLTLQEQLLILELHSKWGNRWSKIAKYLPGRTDNEIKNYWRTRVQKQAQHLKIDCNSKMFRDVIRCFWIPRLLQKMESSPSITTMNSSQCSSTPPAPLLNQGEHQAPPKTIQACLGVSDPTTNGFNHPEMNSSSENCTSSSISLSDSMNSSQLPEISEYPLDSICYDPSERDCYSLDSYSYDMEAFNLASTSASQEFDNAVHFCHLAENNWVDVADSIWNMDELWQFKKLQEGGHLDSWCY